GGVALVGGFSARRHSDCWWTEDGAGWTAWTRDEGAPFARRVQHALFGGPGGAVWLAGGQGPGWRALNDLWRLGAEGQWHRVAEASAWKPRFDFGAAELGDGRMLVTGGGSGQQ
ncbi:unnamed protein product, partial [Prorocentrum cordatum]